MDALSLSGCQPSLVGMPAMPPAQAQLFVTQPLVIMNNTNFGDLNAILSCLENSSSLPLENVKTHVSILQTDQ